MADNITIKDAVGASIVVGSKDNVGVHYPKHMVVDDKGRYGEVDSVGGYQVTMPVGHHKRHEGDMFRFIHRVAVPTGGIHDMVLSTGAGPSRVHIEFGMSGDDKTEVQLYKAPTFTGGIDVTANVYNIDEESINTPTQLTILDSPTVTATGTLRDGVFADKLQQVRSADEHLLALNTSYLLRLDDTVLGKAPIVYMFIEWYEQTNKF